MLLMPFAPKFFNNVGFSYLIAACIEPEVFCGDILMMLVRFLIGGAIYLGGTLVVVKLFSMYQARKAGASWVFGAAACEKGNSHALYHHRDQSNRYRYG